MDYRADDFTAFLGQKITVSAVDLLDDAVSPEYAEAMCYPGSEAPFECYILVTGKEDVCYVSVSKSVDVELTMANGLEKVRVICGPGAQGQRIRRPFKDTGRQTDSTKSPSGRVHPLADT